jgi:hypothetical protein
MKSLLLAATLLFVAFAKVHATEALIFDGRTKEGQSVNRVISTIRKIGADPLVDCPIDLTRLTDYPFSISPVRRDSPRFRGADLFR